MRRAHCSLVCLALFVLPFLAGAALAAGPCPTNTLNFKGDGPFTSTAFAVDTTEAGYPDYHLAYDLRQGTIAMSQGGSLAQTYVLVADLYDVMGVPAGTPVSFTAQLAVEGMVWTSGCGGSGCGGYVSIHLGADGAVSDTTYSISLFNGSQSFSDVRRLPVTIVAGSPLRIEFELSGGRVPGGSHSSSGDGVLEFVGLPAGAVISSCQGYGSQVVPTRHVSWGSVKTIYR